MKRLALAILFITSAAANAALGTLPYKYKITSIVTTGTNLLIAFDILDGGNTVRASSAVNIDSNQDPIYAFEYMQEQVKIQMGVDAGGTAGLLAALSNKSIMVSQ